MKHISWKSTLLPESKELTLSMPSTSHRMYSLIDTSKSKAARNPTRLKEDRPSVALIQPILISP